MLDIEHKRVQWLLCVSLVSFPMLLGCGDSNSGAGGGGDASPGLGGSNQGPSRTCEASCPAKAQRCGQPSDMCSQLCSQVTESQWNCLNATACDDDDGVDRCLHGSTDSTDTTGGASGSTGHGGKPGSSGNQGHGGNPGSGSAGSTGSTDRCFGQSGKCVYDDFFSAGCEADDPTHPYWVTCCEASPPSSWGCKLDEDKDYVKNYCCASH